jgi:hypothetical protein
MTGSYSGCTDAEYPDALVKGKLVVTVRGNCARVDRAILGAKHGAAAVALINNSSGYPVLEGPIPGVNIPFLGIRREDGALLKAATTVDIAGATTIPNTGYKGYASFSSGGPRRGDSMLKPDVTAPGVSIFSTLSGSGNQGIGMSGTSMAAPHVSGVAALVRQSHRSWDSAEQRAAIINTATIGTKFTSSRYKVSRGGAGAVSALAAVNTQAVATTDDDATALSFGFNELTGDYSKTVRFQVTNHGASPLTFSATAAPDTFSRPHTISLDAPGITVRPDDSVDLKVTLSVKASDVLSAAAFRQVTGAIQLTPAAGTNSDVSLRVPYLMVPRARSNVATTLSEGFGSDSPNGSATITNAGGARAGAADFYAWGLQGSNKSLGELGIRAVGAKTDPVNGVLTFAVNTFGRFVTPNVNEYDILIDTTGTGTPNWVLFSMDLGKVAGGAAFDSVRGPGRFNVFTPAISSGMKYDVAVGATLTSPISINTDEWDATRPLGLMVVTTDNRSGGAQAQLLAVR